jgi:diketogulonate reductase-like aldo/keto reductase
MIATLGLADTVPIAEGVEMPRLGFGTYKAHGREVVDAVKTALSLGYRGIDTASAYGNEAEVARAVRESRLPRDDLFVATKVWPSEQGYLGTRAALQGSLRRMGLDHVDLYLVHWPVPSLLEDTWRAMVELRDAEFTRAIGVCNFLPHHLDLLAQASGVPPAVNQFEFHPRLQQPEVVAYCFDHGITIQAWAPIMRGRVGEIPEVVEIAERHGKTAAQVSLRWILQRGITTIPKSVHAERIAENAALFDFELSAEEIAAMDALDRGERLGPHPDHPPA